MNDETYNAFYEAVDVVDSSPVQFEFTDEEAEAFGIDCTDTDRLLGGVVFNLSRRGYPFLRAALIFRLMERKL